DDLELCRDHLEDLAHVLADQTQLTAAIGAGVAEIELAALARRVCRDAGSPRWARRGVRVGGSGREIRVGIVLIACYGGLLCDGDEHVFERELKLCDLALDLLGGLAEGLLLQPGDLQAEGLDDQVMGAQRGRQLRVLGLQRSDHRLEEGGIFGKIGGRVQHGLCYGEMAEKSRKTATFQKEKSPCA